MSMLKKIGLFSGILLGSIMAGTVLLTLVYMLPTEKMEQNVRSSIDIFYTESVYPMQVQGYKSTQLDNETDAVMLLGAIYSGGDKTALERAMCVERIDFTKTHSLCVDLIQYAWENKVPDSVAEYSRYWHGYMVWLKPLLSLFDYADIRMMNMMLQLGGLLVVVAKMCQKGQEKYILPFIMALVVANPVAIAMSMQFSSIYYIVLLSMLLILSYHEKIENRKMYPYLFFTLGIITVFFDFLTYPTAALCMPLVLVIGLEKTDWKSKIKNVFVYSVCFGMGYVGMWAGKWLVGSLVLQENLLGKVMAQFHTHTARPEINGVEVSKLGAIMRNVRIFMRWPYVLCFGGTFIYYCLKIDWKRLRRNTGSMICDIFPYGIILLIPFVWMLITSSHATSCYFFAHREFMSTIFAFFVILQQFYKRNRRGAVNSYGI